MSIQTMTITKFLAATTLLGTLILAGCQSATPVAPSSNTVTAQPTAPAQSAGGTRAALDGVWLPTNEGNVGKYTATFANGNFTTKLTGGGGVIGAGTYKIDSPTQISLVWVGEATGTRNSAKCQWQTSTMSCNSDKGFSFQLRKST
ncbi:MAG: hypothetical protein AAGK38_03705 [Pseudomonadota bacterium]